MIAFLRGKVEYIGDDFIALDVQGVGYQVFTPLAVYDNLPEHGEELFLYTQMIVREDAVTIFGFPRREELEIFGMLLSVSGIGAKTAMLILNMMSPAGIIAAIASDDEKSFTAVSGVGKKTAGRLILELKDKCAKLAPNLVSSKSGVSLTSTVSASSANNLAVNALLQLGFAAPEAKRLAAMAEGGLSEGATLEEIIMAALKYAGR